MFFYTKGFLKKANERGSLLNNSMTSSPSAFSRIKLRSYECPVIVRVDNISYSTRDNILLMNLHDGESTLEVTLDICKWSVLNGNENKIEKGSVIIIYEYTFEDVKVEGRDNIKDMIKILECTLVGSINECPEETKPLVNIVNSVASTCSKEFTISEQVEKYNASPCEQMIDPKSATSSTKSYTCDTININLNNQNWLFRAQLLKISPVKEFINKFTNANGQYMRLQFGDSTGIIELVGFNEQVLKFQNCQVEKFYVVTNADVKYSKGSTQAWEDTGVSKIELVMNVKTTIEEYEEKLKTFKIFEKPAVKNETKKSKHCLTLNEISTKKDGDMVSTIAVISHVEDFKEITPKNKSPINIRNFYIADQTLPSVKVAVWGKQAEEFNYKVGNVLILNKIKISHFNGLSLSVQWETALMKVEDNWDHIEEANELKEWWKNKESGTLISTLKRKLSIV